MRTTHTRIGNMAEPPNELGYADPVYVTEGGNPTRPLGAADPTLDEHAATKAYVDAHVATGTPLLVAGGAAVGTDIDMSGNGVVDVGNASAAADAAIKAYADSRAYNWAPVDGSQPFTASVNMTNTYRVRNVADPVASADAATKAFQDAATAASATSAGDTMTGDLRFSSGSLVTDVIQAKTTSNGVVAEGITMDSTGTVTVPGNLAVTGGMVQINSTHTAVAASHLAVSADYTAVSARSGGVVVNYLPTPITDTVAGAAFATTSTVETTGGGTFQVGDIILVSGANEGANDGLYEVLSHAGTTLTIRTTGGTPPLEGFSQTSFVADATVAGTIRNVTVSVLRATTAGAWQTALGSRTGATGVEGLTYTSLASAAGFTMGGDLAMGTNKITDLQDPSSNQDAATKAYTDNVAATAVPLTGATLSGNIAMGGFRIRDALDPAVATDAATRAYADAAIGAGLSLGGGTMSGNIDLAGNQLVGLSHQPTGGTDIVSKKYIDDHVPEPTGSPSTGDPLYESSSGVGIIIVVDDDAQILYRVTGTTLEALSYDATGTLASVGSVATGMTGVDYAGFHKAQNLVVLTHNVSPAELLAVDITDPANMVPGTVQGLPPITGIVRFYQPIAFKTFVLVATNSPPSPLQNIIARYDVGTADPKNPVYLDYYDATTVTGNAMWFLAHDPDIYADVVFGQCSNSQVVVLNYNDPANPAVVDTFVTGNYRPTITLVSPTLLVAQFYTNFTQLHILDGTTGARVSVTTSSDPANFDYGGAGAVVPGIGPLFFALNFADARGPTIRTYNLTNGTLDEYVDQLWSPTATTLTGSPHNAAYAPSIGALFVSDGNGTKTFCLPVGVDSSHYLLRGKPAICNSSFPTVSASPTAMTAAQLLGGIVACPAGNITLPDAADIIAAEADADFFKCVVWNNSGAVRTINPGTNTTFVAGSPTTVANASFELVYFLKDGSNYLVHLITASW